MDKIDALYDRLIEALEQLLAAHGRLAEYLEAKRAALRAADYRRVTELCEDEHPIVQQISELEKHRLQICADLTLALDPGAARPEPVTALAQRLDPPRGERLLRMREELVACMRRIRKDTSVARRATEALVAHMQGLVLAVGSVCGGGGVYGRDGAPPPETMTMSTFSATA